jgi:hypothetical protein
MPKLNSPLSWQDETSEITVAANNGTGTNPTWAAFRGNINGYRFAEGDNVWLQWHVRHHYAPGTAVHLHVHWSTDTSTSAANDGQTVIFTFDYSTAKGYDQEFFPADQAINTATYTFAGGAQKQYRHLIAETAGITNSSIETDGIILARLSLNAASTFTGNVFVFMSDMHYQTDDGTGTLLRNGPSWSKI